MGLIVVVIGILTDDDDFDVVKRGMTRPDSGMLDVFGLTTSNFEYAVCMDLP